MRVLVATNSYPTKKNSTHQTFIRNIYKGLKSRGVTVDIVYNPYFRYFKSDLETGNMLTSVIKTLFLFIAYLPYILFKAKRYDIIYSHAPVLPGFFMLAAQKIHAVKHVCYVHGSVNFYSIKKGLLYKTAQYTMNKCNLVVTNSGYMVNRLENEYGCYSKIITPGYNNTIYKYQNTKRMIDLFFAGSTLKRKGIGLLLRTINRYKKFYTERNLCIKMNFSGGNKKMYLDYAELNKIDSIIQFGDRLNETELIKAYQNSKVFLFPSSEEPLGLVGIEAIACGAIVVGTNSGGIKEFVIHGENGFLFEQNNVDELQFYIEKALREFPDFQKRQPAVSETVHHYSLENAMDQTLALFREIMKNNDVKKN